MSLIYFASPYSHPDTEIRKQRYNNVLNMTAELLKRGYHVYAPIVHNHHINLVLDNTNEICAFERWREYDINLLRRCDTLWIFIDDGWKQSVGIKEEYKVAKLLGISMAFIDLFGNICPIWGDIYAPET